MIVSFDKLIQDLPPHLGWRVAVDGAVQLDGDPLVQDVVGELLVYHHLRLVWSEGSEMELYMISTYRGPPP